MEREIIERVTTERGELQLQRRGDTYEVISNGCFLMATYNGGSERAMVDLAADWVKPRLPRRVLIGGLGVGYTLQAALSNPGVQQVTVVEIEQTVVDWNRRYLSEYNGGALDDPRVELVIADMAELLATPPKEPYDLILIDTDNGPDWVVFESNQTLWSARGLDWVDRWRAPGGVLAFWSAQAAPDFESLLRRRYSEVRASPVRAAVSPVDDVIYLAK